MRKIIILVLSVLMILYVGYSFTNSISKGDTVDTANIQNIPREEFKLNELTFLDTIKMIKNKDFSDKGIFDKGMFNNGPFDKGIFDKGMFDNGPFDKGIFDKGIFNNGPFNKGIFDKGMFENGIFGKGTPDDEGLLPNISIPSIYEIGPDFFGKKIFTNTILSSLGIPTFSLFAVPFFFNLI